MNRYYENARHPWACLLFVAPLLFAYEAGQMMSHRAVVLEGRNGAEVWLRQGLDALGFSAEWTAPALLLAVFLGWSLLRRRDRPGDPIGVLIGMVVESTLFALGLYALSQALLPLLNGLGILLQTSQETSPRTVLDPSVEKIVRYLGAGIYEETLFRLGLFSLLYRLFEIADIPLFWALNLGAITSAVAFAAAHHLGSAAEPFQPAVFTFRVVAGVYFAWLYRLRGFGIAVGSHAGYDLLVGLLMQ